MTEVKNAVLKALIQIAENGPKQLNSGICENLRSSLAANAQLDFTDEEYDDLIDPLFKSWPEKSYSDSYPVGSWSMSPSNLFWDHYDNNRNMWDKSTRYGRARWSLLNHMIKELSQ